MNINIGGAPGKGGWDRVSWDKAMEDEGLANGDEAGVWGHGRERDLGKLFIGEVDGIEVNDGGVGEIGIVDGASFEVGWKTG